MRPGLSIVIPSYNRPDLLQACLSSVQRHAPSGTQILVVDDASVDGVISGVASRFAGVEVIRLPQRGGFCVAANTGIEAARNPIVELLNDDAEVCAGWAESALTAFDDPTVAAVAPLVLRWGREDIIDSAGDDYHPGGFARKRGHDQPLSARHLRPRFVFGASGSSAFYRRDVVREVGAFPVSFGAYFEDVDLSFRLHRAGYRVRYEPRSRVLHHVSSSHRPSAALIEQQSRNEELVYWRNMTACDLLLSLPLHVAVLAAKAWRRLLAGELRPFLRGRMSAMKQIGETIRHRAAAPQTSPWPH